LLAQLNIHPDLALDVAALSICSEGASLKTEKGLLISVAEIRRVVNEGYRPALDKAESTVNA